MSEIVWSQHPSIRAQAGGLISVGVLALALAAGWWWLPMLAVRLALPDAVAEAAGVVAAWMPLALLLPFAQVAKAWIGSRLTRYDLTAERLMVSRGLVLKRVDNLELYRVRDLHLELPLIGRLFGVGNVILDTVDHTSPTVVLNGVKRPDEVFARLRDLTEACRRRAGIPGMA
jgi:uncharacterized membrane protein YdbT with pleckstrin-like domain